MPFNSKDIIQIGGSGGASTFLGLTDTPSSYTGQALKGARVNAGETAIEFFTLGGGTGTVTSVSSTSGDLTVTNPTTTPSLTVVSAPKLTTARNINGVAFDGTGNITVADSTKQPVDAGLTSISALTGAGYVKATATDTFSQVTTIPNTDITGLGTLSTQSGTFSGTSSGTNTGDQTITLTGDVTGSGTGSFATTIGTNVVTNAKSAQMAANTFKANNTGSTANASDITVAQAKTLLAITESDVSGLVSDLALKAPLASPTFTGTVTLPAGQVVNGVTLTTAGGTSNFLRADGTYAAPAGGGDMVLASVQTVSGLKTFLDTKFALRNVANTFSGFFTNTNTADRTYTLKDSNGTIAFTSDITGINSGTNTGDQTITLTGGVTGSGTGSFATTVVTNANLTGPVTSTGNATAIANGAISNAMLANGAVANLSGTNTGDNAVNTLYSGLVSNATHTGDATGATALTLATVNSNVGTFGSATQVASPTVNAKGLVTAISNVAISIPSTAVSDFNSASRAQTEAELVAGTNITITPSGTGATRQLTIASTGGGGGTMTVQDEGSTTSTTVTTLNFTGAGVTASGAGATATINISGGGGGGVTKGIAEIDFGANTQQSDVARVTVTDASISATSYPIASPYAIATTDHDPDDYSVESISATISNIVVGVSFDIVARAPNLTFGKYKFVYHY